MREISAACAREISAECTQDVRTVSDKQCVLSSARVHKILVHVRNAECALIKCGLSDKCSARNLVHDISAIIIHMYCEAHCSAEKSIVMHIPYQFMQT